jgi:hypothetical protein
MFVVEKKNQNSQQSCKLIVCVDISEYVAVKLSNGRVSAPEASGG